MPVLKTCPTCGKEFYSSPSHNRTYCSKECTYPNAQSHLLKICPICGNAFSDPKHPTRKFCCRTCADEGHKRITEYKCKRCGRVFRKQPSQLRGGYCCLKCANEALGELKTDPSNKVTKQCPVCGKMFTEYAYRKINHCSSVCAGISRRGKYLGINNHNYKGGSPKNRGLNWHDQKKATLERDGYRCQVCGKKVGRKGWDHGIHHIKPYRLFNGDYLTANQLSNLVTLCRKCHAKVECGKLPCPKPLF